MNKDEIESVMRTLEIKELTNLDDNEMISAVRIAHLHQSPERIDAVRIAHLAQNPKSRIILARYRNILMHPIAHSEAQGSPARRKRPTWKGTAINKGAAKRLEDERAMRQPPRSAELLLTAFASTKHAEAIIGDLNERYASWCKRFGVRQAQWLYWVRAAQSIGPLLLRWLGKVLKWAAVISTVKRALGW